MYSTKPHILELVALLKAHQISQIVVCPGSRNIPIVGSIIADKYFASHQVTDERSAAFVALGLALKTGRTTAVVCTSGSAVLNMHPAVAEAYYQKVPLLVISADRPEGWIGQQDGQTLPQKGVFQSLSKCSVQLDEHDIWLTNRLVNEAILATTHQGKGPAHINVPISEPFFDMTADRLPKVRVIHRYHGMNEYNEPYTHLIEELNKAQKRLVVVGQMNSIYDYQSTVNKLIHKHFAWVQEHIGNGTIPGKSIRNIDILLAQMNDEEKHKLSPDLLITWGGCVISKRTKQWLRSFPPKAHWHISADGALIDTFQCATTLIQMDPMEFVERIAPRLAGKVPTYPQEWIKVRQSYTMPALDYSAPMVVGEFMRVLPEGHPLHLANSNSIRYAQLYDLPKYTEVYANRGVNGIEGSLSTALGFAALDERPVYLIIGDLSFFYDMTALNISPLPKNLRILLLNNHEGQIFRGLPGLHLPDKAREAVQGTHNIDARSWAMARGLHYFGVQDTESLHFALPEFTAPEAQKGAMLMEVFTDASVDQAQLDKIFKK